MTPEEQGKYIRGMLLASSGSYLCNKGTCQVITQGGLTGLRSHQRT